MIDRPEEIRSLLVDRRYRRGSELGYGRYAIAYEAEDTSDNDKRVVIKLMRMEKEDFDKRQIVFNNEISILDRLHRAATNSNNQQMQLYHSNIIKYIANGTHRERSISKGLRYLVFEPLSHDSMSIHEIVGEKPNERGKLGIMLADEVIDVLIGCCDALILAHSCKITYCDLKPEHVFWDGSQVTLVDWNMARKDESFDGRLMKKDLFRLGALAYYMLTGSCPSENINAIWPRKYLIENNPLDNPYGDREGIPTDIDFGIYEQIIPAELQQLIRNILAEELRYRPADAKAIKEQLLYIKNERINDKCNLIKYEDIQSSAIRDALKVIIKERKHKYVEELIEKAIDDNPDDDIAKELLFWIKLAKDNLRDQT